MSNPTPLVISLRVIKLREGGKLCMEIEIVLSDGVIVSKTVDATKTIQLDFTDSCEVTA